MAYQRRRQSPQSSSFEQYYLCFPVSSMDKPHLEIEKGDKIIMPPSALDRLASMAIDYPMLFEIHNPVAERSSHCGVLEFSGDEGLVYLPNWMMANMAIEEGSLVQLKNVSLPKGTYAKLQPHTQDFLDITNPKAVLEKALRSYSCLTTNDTIMVPYNNKEFYLNVVETKPSFAVTIIETDCEVDFAPPLDYIPPVQPEKPAPAAYEDQHPHKTTKFNPFTGSVLRLDGKPSIEPTLLSTAPTLVRHQPKDLYQASDQHSTKLVFGSKKTQPLNGSANTAQSESRKVKPQKVEDAKFQAFKGTKYSLV